MSVSKERKREYDKARQAKQTARKAELRMLAQLQEKHRAKPVYTDMDPDCAFLNGGCGRGPVDPSTVETPEQRKARWEAGLAAKAATERCNAEYDAIARRENPYEWAQSHALQRLHEPGAFRRIAKAAEAEYATLGLPDDAETVPENEEDAMEIEAPGFLEWYKLALALNAKEGVKA